MTDWMKEVRERCEKATSGPWGADCEPWPGNQNLQYWINTHDDGLACAVSKDDAKFIACAREDIPKLLEEVEMLKVLKEGYRRLAEKYKSSLEVIELQAINGNRNNRLCRVIEDTARQALEESK